MFYATRHQVYYRFDTYGMTFASTLIWYYIYINTHNINHHSVHWGFNPTQKHRPLFFAKPPSLKSANCPANCNAPWKRLPLPLFASNHLSNLRSCQALPFWKFGRRFNSPPPPPLPPAKEEGECTFWTTYWYQKFSLQRLTISLKLLTWRSHVSADWIL